MLTSALVTVAGLFAYASVTPYDPLPVYPPAGPEAIREVHELIVRLEGLPRFSPDAVEKAVAVKLAPAEPMPDPKSLTAKLPAGTFSDVFYREIRPVKEPPRWLVAVSIRRGVSIPFEAVDRKFIGRQLHGATAGSYESVGTHTLDRPGGLLHLRRGMSSGTLQEIILVREGSPERTHSEHRLAHLSGQSSELTALVKKIEALPRFSLPSVEAIIGRTMGPSNSDTPELRSWEQRLIDGVVSGVRYREFKPRDGTPTWTLSLVLRKDVSLPQRFMDPDLITTRSPFRVRADTDSAGNLRELTFTREGLPDRPSGR